MYADWWGSGEMPKYTGVLAPSQKPSVVGFTRCSDQGICEIQILKDYYPECLEHESRHVFDNIRDKIGGLT